MIDKDIIAQRKLQYGNSFPLIAELFSNYIAMKYPEYQITFTPEDVAMMMALMKVSRLANSPDHKDSLTDLANYFYIAQNYQEYLELKPEEF